MTIPNRAKTGFETSFLQWMILVTNSRDFLWTVSPHILHVPINFLRTPSFVLCSQRANNRPYPDNFRFVTIWSCCQPEHLQDHRFWRGGKKDRQGIFGNFNWDCCLRLQLYLAWLYICLGRRLGGRYCNGNSYPA